MRADPPPPAPPQSPQSPADWLGHLVDQTDLAGWMEPVGARHHGLYLEDGPDLLVTFEQMEALCRQPVGQYPASWQIAKAAGWSIVSLICEGETGYRDKAVWDYIDRLADQAFFDGFERVLFYGTGPGGHAACVYSVAAPGARVLALSPLATLSPREAGWDHRYPQLRRQNYSHRYAYGPDLIAAAAEAHLICDPQECEDSMHATLYRLGGARVLSAPGAGPDPAAVLQEAELLAPLLSLALEGRLNPAAWAQLWRGRRQSLSWLRNQASRAGPLREGLFLAQARALSGVPADLRPAADRAEQAL